MVKIRKTKVLRHTTSSIELIMKKISLVGVGATAVILIIALVVLVTAEVRISNNATCTVSIFVVEEPAPWQYPFDNVSSCCTTFSFTNVMTSYASAVTENMSSGNIVTINDTQTETDSGIPGLQWTDTVCTYTG